MKNLIKLVKINLLTFFDFHKLKNAKTFSDYKKVIPKLLLYLYAFGVLSVSIYSGAKFGIKGLQLLNAEYLILVVLMAVSSTYTLISTIFKVNKTVFDAKDYSILLGLPLKKTTIIASKVLILYISNLIYVSLFMIPAYIAYTLALTPNSLFHLYYWISLMFLPLIPTIIGSIIGSLMTALASNFKYKNLINIILSFIAFVTIMLLSFSTNNMSAIDFANFSNAMIEKYNQIYPLTKVYTEIISNESLLNLTLFIVMSSGLFWLYQLVLNRYFDIINSRLNAVTINKKYKVKKLTKSNSFIALYKKELKKYFSSFIYVLNTAFGPLMLIIMLIAFAFIGTDQLDAILSIPGASNLLVLYAPLVFCVFCSLSCTTNASISLEAKSLWLLKTLPLSTKQIFMAKIMVNLTILVPSIIIGSVFLAIILELSLLHFIILLLIPICFAFFVSALGLLTNLFFPDFEWTNEIKVIKQSLAVFVTLAVGMTITIVPLMIKTNIEATKYTIIIGSVFLILTIIIYRMLFTIGHKIFKRL